jgi:abortive infection bacteriophage resistance protein
MPPAWMTLETLSFGNLSKLFANLNGKSIATKNILHYFGLPKLIFLVNWMHTISALTHIAAHQVGKWL